MGAPGEKEKGGAEVGEKEKGNGWWVLADGDS